MKRKNSFFLIGMTSVLLAFAMIGCDNGTSNGGSTTPTSPYTPTPQPGSSVTSEGELRTALTSGATPIYVVGAVTLTKALEIPSGYQVLVTETANTDNGTVIRSEGGPLFEEVRGNGSLNSGAYTLTVKPTAGLYAQRAQAVVVASRGDLIVEAGATLGSSAASGVVIAPSANTHLNKGAILAVTTTPGSIVVQQDASSSGKLTDEGSKVVIEGIDDNTTVALYAATMDDSGASIAPIVTIPAGVPANISDEVTVYATVAEAESGTSSLTAVNTAVKEQAEAASKGSLERTTSDAEKVNSLFNPTTEELAAGAVAATEVTYTGDTALDTVSVPANAKLIITGEVAESSITVGNGAALEIAEGASISGTITITAAATGATKGTVTNNGTIKTASDISLVTAAGTGTIVITGTATATGNITLTQKLEIGAGGSIAFDNAVTGAAFSGGGTLTLSGNGALTLGSGVTSLGKTVIFADEASGTVTTGNATVAALNTLLGQTAKLTATAIEVSSGTPTLTVPADTALTITDLTVSGTLTVAATGTISATGTSNAGTIKAADVATLKKVLAWTSLSGNVAVVGNVEIVADSETLAIPNNTTLTLAENQALTASGTIEGAGSINAEADGSSLVVDENGVFTLSGGTVTGDVTQVVEGIDISGPTGTDLTLASVKKDLQTGDTNGFITIKLGGSVGMTIPDDEGDDDLYSTIFSENTAEGALIEGAATTGYSAVRITGLFDNETGASKITQYNQAFNMWTKYTYTTYIANEAVNADGIYGTTDVYKEKSTYTGLTAAETFDIPLWNGWDEDDGDAPRIIKLEITQPATTSENKKTFLIDFADVEFVAEPSE